MTNPDPSTPGDQLAQGARLYVRLAGDATLDNVPRFLAELPRGASSFVPLRAAGVAFELQSERNNAPLAIPEISAPEPASLDDWISVLSRIACLASTARESEVIQAGEDRTLAPGKLLQSPTPLWLVCDDPVLHYRTGNEPGPAVRCLPLCTPLAVTCTEERSVRANDSAEFLRDFGVEGLNEAMDHTAAVIAAWCLAQESEQHTRRQKAAAQDEGLVNEVYENLARTTEFESAPQLEEQTDALLGAIKAIGREEGFDVVIPFGDHVSIPAPERMKNIALASDLRYREVTLGGQWWLEEGPPLLVWKRGTQLPLAAIRRGSKMKIMDLSTGGLMNIDERLAGELETFGHMLYPPLPHEVSWGALRDFVLHGSRRELRAMLGVGALAMIIGLIVPVATGVVVQTAIPDGRLDLLAQMVLIVVSAAIGTASFSAGRSFAMIRASGTINVRLQSAIWDRVLRLPSRFFHNFTTGDLAMRVLGVDQARRLLTGPVLNGLVGGLFAGLSFILMLIYDWRLAIFGFAFALATGIVLYVMARRLLGFLRQFRDAEGRVSGRIIDFLVGVNKLRIAGAEERAFMRWAELFSSQQQANWKSGRISAAQSVVTTILPSLGILGMVVVAGNRSTPINLAAFAVFSVAMGQFLVSVSAMAMTIRSGLEAIPLLERIKPVLEAKPEVEQGRKHPGTLTGRIHIKNVSFRYHEDLPLVLRDIDISIEPGEFVAIVGPSGSGKSTLLRLLLGFETPLTGSISFDDQNLNKLDLRLVRRQLGTVLQDAGLVPGSIYMNIAGAAPLSDEEVMEAARQAGLDEFIEQLPMGLETLVSEDAGTFSGGQRQRLMIARAVVHKPAILFFDEATSALDNSTQAIVSASLDALNVTRLVIAHRLSTIRHADRIVVIEGGRIVEEGRYQELMRREGTFHQMAKRQLV